MLPPDDAPPAVAVGVVDASDAKRAALRLAAVSMAIVAALAGVGLASHGPDWFVHFGRTSPSADIADSVLGSPVDRPYVEGHDGTAYWLLARDPLLRDTTDLEAGVDRPAYRAQRIAYPLLAAPWRVAGEEGVVWGLVVTNVVIVGVGAYLTARLAQSLGLAAGVGAAAFVANPVVVQAVVTDLAEALVLASAVGLVLAARQGRWAWALVAAVVAVLAKEGTWLVVVAVAAGATGGSRRARATIAVGSATVGAAWAVYARARLGWPGSQVEELTPVPFGGWVGAWRDVWAAHGRWAHALVAVLLLAGVLWSALRWWRRRTIELWASLPGALLVVATPQVLHLATNSARVVTVSITMVALDLLAERGARAGGARAPTTLAVCPGGSAVVP